MTKDGKRSDDNPDLTTGTVDKKGTVKKQTSSKNVSSPSSKGLCKGCGIRTHTIAAFNQKMPVNNSDVHYGVCIKCRPNDVSSAVRKAWEEKQDSGKANSSRGVVVQKNKPMDKSSSSRSSGTGPEGSVQNKPMDKSNSSRSSGKSVDFAKPASTKPRLADQIIDKERRETLEKQGLCPNCGIRTHKISRFSREPLKNRDVHYGVCIKCNPDEVVPSVRKAWEDKLKSSRYLEVEEDEDDEEESEVEDPPIAAPEKKPIKKETKTPRSFTGSYLLPHETPELWPREDTPVSLGWNPDERHVYHHVIPFCSSTKRSRDEKQEDREDFGGINRCVFSNLFVDNQPLYVAPGAEFMGHASQFSNGLCAQSFYMAAKCELECDALFIMNDLKKSAHIERFCHNRLELMSEQKQKLIEYGADPTDFRRVDSSSDENGKWFRWADGKMPVRSDWYSVRLSIVLHILRHKFGGDRGYVTQKTVKALRTLICEDGELPIIVEHRIKDGFWGDGQDGSGYSILGKTITQVLLEITGVAATAPFLSKSEASRQLFHPNTEIVDYEYPESSSEEEDEGAIKAESEHSDGVPYDLKTGKPLRRLSGTEGSTSSGPVVQYDVKTGKKMKQ